MTGMRRASSASPMPVRAMYTVRSSPNLRDCDIFETRSTLNATRLYTRLYVNGAYRRLCGRRPKAHATGNGKAWLLAVAAKDAAGHACDFPRGNPTELTGLTAANNRRPFRWAKNDQPSLPDGRTHPTERLRAAVAIKKPLPRRPVSDCGTRPRSWRSRPTVAAI